MTSQPKILVVDDERSIRLFLEEELSRRGYLVVCVETGEDALAQIARDEFDVALLDLKLPGISGLEVLHTLRRRWPDTGVIMLTAHATLESSIEALRQGAQDYLFKPCRPADLRESVRTALERRQQALRQRNLLVQLKQTMTRNLEELGEVISEPVEGHAAPPDPETPDKERFYQQGLLVIDQARHVITWHGRLLDLSPLEFEIVAYLARCAPKVVSAQELVRGVQGFDSDPWEASNLMRSHIHHIRQKVRAVTGAGELIRTVRGIGYALIVG
ncbi:MAG: response regulator transcription factor [Anaerolineae bacterium]|nr:response regulator transcription factor [Anaerolineae bacterium]